MNTGMTRICTLDALAAATVAKMAVVVPTRVQWSKPKPAAFMMNLSGMVLYDLIAAGMFLYRKN